MCTTKSSYPTMYKHWPNHKEGSHVLLWLVIIPISPDIMVNLEIGLDIKQIWKVMKKWKVNKVPLKIFFSQITIPALFTHY